MRDVGAWHGEVETVVGDQASGIGKIDRAPILQIFLQYSKWRRGACGWRMRSLLLVQAMDHKDAQLVIRSRPHVMVCE